MRSYLLSLSYLSLLSICLLSCSDSGDVIRDDSSPIDDLPVTYSRLDSLVSSNRLVAKDQVSQIKDYEVYALKNKAKQSLEQGRDTVVARKNLNLITAVERLNEKNQQILDSDLYQPAQLRRLEHAATFELDPTNSTMVRVSQVNRKKYVNAVVPEDIAGIGRYQAYYLSRLPKAGKFQPVVIQVYDDDFAASYLLLLDTTGKLTDHLKMSGGFQNGAPTELEGKYALGWEDRYDADIARDGSIILTKSQSKSTSDADDAETVVTEDKTTYKVTANGKFEQVATSSRTFTQNGPLWK